MVTALDDVCTVSPRSFDAQSLAALLGEVCLWLVEQRIGPRAHHVTYKACDPYAQVGSFILCVSRRCGGRAAVVMLKVQQPHFDLYFDGTTWADIPYCVHILDLLDDMLSAALLKPS